MNTPHHFRHVKKNPRAAVRGSGSHGESQGPGGKVRGNPQQLIDRYMSLGRDALREGDSPRAENCFQHAEHYRRILAAMPKRPIAEHNAVEEIILEETEVSLGENQDVWYEEETIS